MKTIFDYALPPKVEAPALTVCKECSHLVNLAPESTLAHLWYNHVCDASPLPTERDPYDGEVKSFGVNDLGVKYYTEVLFHYCRDVNNGACLKFEKKK